MVLHLSGASLNAISAVGIMIAVGVIVDDVVGLVDGVLQRARTPRPGDEERSHPELVTEAVLESRRPVVYATFIILGALVPLLFITGVLRRLPAVARRGVRGRRHCLADRVRDRRAGPGGVDPQDGPRRAT